MSHPEVRYRSTAWPTYLELDGWDGTCRGVAFKDEPSTLAALATGRAEHDSSAITDGLLPTGATLVSRAGVSPSLDISNAVILPAAASAASSTQYVTPERDQAARLGRPDDSRTYDSLIRSTANVAVLPDAANGTTIH